MTQEIIITMTQDSETESQAGLKLNCWLTKDAFNMITHVNLLTAD